jgi:hypothetical protein
MTTGPKSGEAMEKSLLDAIEASTGEGHHKTGRFLLQGLCDRYQGDYNPHYLTGLGSALWVVDQYRHQPNIAVNGLYQYLDFFFSGLKS